MSVAATVKVALVILAAASAVATGCAAEAPSPASHAGAAEPAKPRLQAAPAERLASPTPRPAPTPTRRPLPEAISLSATGDIIMGDAPGQLPSNGGRGFFDGVEAALAADFVMGNLEQPLTGDTGHGKCGGSSGNCHQFRAPPAYAAHLRDAGFDLLNQANNHANDYGPSGYRNTQRALEAHGLDYTGAPGRIAITDVKGVKVAVLGFSSYASANDLNDLAKARRLVAKASERADVVAIQVHMGAEGSDKIHVRPGTEMYYGENRGDPVRFSHAVVDAGADLVIGHGPHVMRPMEFYRGRLIAYSLGNFAGGAGTLNNSGRLGLGAVLKVVLRPDGSWREGKFVSTFMNGAGRPTIDRSERGLSLVRQLSRSDFPRTGARLDRLGRITRPTSSN